MPEINFARPWRIVAAPGDHPTTRLTASELHTTLQTITGQAMPVVDEPSEGDPAIVLRHAWGPGDGFGWQATPDQIDLLGDSPRGLLYAAYGLLEALGCRWIAPGPLGERLPSGTRFSLPDAVHESPALPGRCLILGHHAFLRDAADWIVWAGRNRINTVFFHVIEGPLAFGAAPARQYLALREQVVPLARQRGMAVEHGGHGLAALLPRKLFKTLPNAFRYHDGARTPDHNFCPSNEAALAIVREKAADHFRAYPEVDVFHLWADDILGGGWCECERCRDYSPSDQALLATNAVAEALESVNPAAQLSFLAYHDTEDAPRRVTPRHNVCLLWAPRKRCYAHPTDNPACRVNVPHYESTFRAQVETFAQAGAAPARVFEYYLDAILFKSVLPPLPTVMQRDLRFYRDAGAHTVQGLMTGVAPWLAPQLNVWLFARLAWNPDQDLETLIGQFCVAMSGAPGAGTRRLTPLDSPEQISRGLGRYYRALEAAYALALDLSPELEQEEIDPQDSLWAVIAHPPADVGDPVHAPLHVLRDKLRHSQAILDLLDQAEAALHEAPLSAAQANGWRRERLVFDLHRRWLHFDLARLRLYEALAQEPIAAEARARYDEARQAFEDVLAWGRAHIDDRRYRINFEFQHRLFWGLRLEKIHADILASLPGRLLIWARVLIRSVVQLYRMVGLDKE